jgi:RHS repeat-associated protein
MFRTRILETLDGASYAVDNAGNRTSRTPQPSGTASNFSYDNIYELTQVTQGSSTTESYTYDPVGNRLSSLGVSSYTNNSSNELTSTSNATYTYDNNGNTTSKTDSTGTTNYTWDFENHLTSVTLPGSGGTVSFKYDPLGRRIYKSSSSGTSIYAYDGDNLIEETNSSGTVVARYSQTPDTMDEPLAMIRGGATSFYDLDGLGSTTSLSSSAGSLARTYTFDSFGKTTASSGALVNPFQFTSRELDTETNLYNFRARYYDQNSGRFLSEDPIAFSSDTYNFYDYVGNDPIDFSDPSGNKKIHGNWCGPNWTGGQKEPFIPSDDVPGFYKPPIDYVDKVCSHHDRCYSKCREKHPCSPWGRRGCERKCDFFLVGRLVGNPKDVYRPWAYVIGLGITLNIVPSAGPNGGAEPTKPAACCKGGPPPAGAGAQ